MNTIIIIYASVHLQKLVKIDEILQNEKKQVTFTPSNHKNGLISQNLAIGCNVR